MRVTSIHFRGFFSVSDPRFRSEPQPSSSPQQRQAQIFQQYVFLLLSLNFWLTKGVRRQLSPGELAHQESLVQEREDEIREIESGIHELSEIFRDLGTLVTEQGGMLGAHIFPSWLTFQANQD